MIFKETALKGAYVIDPELLEDERGFFARIFSGKEFKERGLNPNVAECSISYNEKRGTLRGMHYQTTPFEEVKLVTCTRGAVYDVILDLRHDSPTFGHWSAVELSDTNYLTLYIPKGLAHGFQTLEDNSMIYYQISEFYHPEKACGVRWDDPAFCIEWPKVNKRIISEKDRGYPDYRKS
jgi:dTDP-4-dehydrorhamnose 3,5-epimerase